jgi:hypothetical protein
MSWRNGPSCRRRLHLPGRNAEVRHPRRMNSRSSSLGGSVKIATRFEVPACTRSAASSNPAAPESTDRTMTSAGVIGLLVTSAHPAAHRTGSRMGRTASQANAVNATNTRTRVPTALTTGMPCSIHPLASRIRRARTSRTWAIGLLPSAAGTRKYAKASFGQMSLVEWRTGVASLPMRHR